MQSYYRNYFAAKKSRTHYNMIPINNFILTGGPSTAGKFSNEARGNIGISINSSENYNGQVAGVAHLYLIHKVTCQ